MLLLAAAALAQPDSLTFSGAGMDLAPRQGGFRSDPRRTILDRADPGHYDPELPRMGENLGEWKARRRADRTERQFPRPSQDQADRLTVARYVEPGEARLRGEYGMGGEKPFYKTRDNMNPFTSLFKPQARARAPRPAPRARADPHARALSLARDRSTRAHGAPPRGLA